MAYDRHCALCHWFADNIASLGQTEEKFETSPYAELSEHEQALLDQARLVRSDFQRVKQAHERQYHPRETAAPEMPW